MTGAVDRMIVRARAPQPRVRPLLPSRYEPDAERGAADAGWSVDEVSVPAAAAEEPAAAEPMRPAPVEYSHARVPDAFPETALEREQPTPTTGRAAAAPAAEPPPDARPARARRPAAEATASAAAPAAARPRSPVSAAPRPPRDGRPGAVIGAEEPREAHRREEPAVVERWIESPPLKQDERRRERPAGASPRARAAARADARSGTTEVTISIGHIEVRAAPPAEPARRPAPRARVTLEEFLRRREGGAR